MRTSVTYAVIGLLLATNPLVGAPQAAKAPKAKETKEKIKEVPHGTILYQMVPELQDEVAYTIIDNHIVYVHPKHKLLRGLYYFRKASAQVVRTPHAKRHPVFTIEYDQAGNPLRIETSTPWVWSACLKKQGNYVHWQGPNAIPYNEQTAPLDMDPSPKLREWREKQDAALAKAAIEKAKKKLTAEKTAFEAKLAKRKAQKEATPPKKDTEKEKAEKKELPELQAMAKLVKLVETARAKMSPEQRAEFDNSVAELTKEFSESSTAEKTESTDPEKAQESSAEEAKEATDETNEEIESQQ